MTQKIPFLARRRARSEEGSYRPLVEPVMPVFVALFDAVAVPSAVETPVLPVFVAVFDVVAVAAVTVLEAVAVAAVSPVAVVGPCCDDRS